MKSNTLGGSAGTGSGAAGRRPPPRCQPSFSRAFHGIWLFTWRSQLAWRRLPQRILILLALPLLVYVTTTSSQAWSRRHASLGNAAERLDVLSRYLARSGVPLRREQREAILPIFQEEFARAESEAGGSPNEETGADRQTRQLQDCYDRISNRVRAVLDERQFAGFEDFRRRQILRSQNRSDEPAWSWTEAFYRWLIDLYFFILLPLSCVRASGALIRDELQSDTLGFLTTRPLSRAGLLAAKYLAQTVWLQLLFLVETALLFAAGELRQIPALGALLPLFLAVQLLAVFAWSALGALLGLVTRRYLALALLYGLIVELGIGRIPTNINTLSLMRHLKTLLAHNPALLGIYHWPGTGVALPVGALLLAVGLFLGTAMALFTLVEYHHSVEMQR
jgi:hypothetical protein